MFLAVASAVVATVIVVAPIGFDGSDIGDSIGGLGDLGDACSGIGHIGCAAPAVAAPLAPGATPTSATFLLPPPAEDDARRGEMPW